MTCLNEMTGMENGAKAIFKKRVLEKEFGKQLEKIHCIVAEVNGNVVGMGGLDGNEIKRMYCDPEYRGRHIGTRIYTELAVNAKKAGLQTLYLEASLNAEGFYRKIGFKRIKTHIWIVGGYEVQNVIMEKRISNTKDIVGKL
jgi:N-acetylglutamate synthase-like GNAT family acetyltransferase